MMELDPKLPIVVGGDDKVSIAASNQNIHELVARRLSRFILITIAYCTILTLILGFNAIQSQRAVQGVAADAAIIAAQRTASCAYTKSFEGIFTKWASALSIVNVSLTPSIVNTKRRTAFVTLFADLKNLGTKACIKAEPIQKTTWPW